MSSLTLKTEHLFLKLADCVNDHILLVLEITFAGVCSCIVQMPSYVLKAKKCVRTWNKRLRMHCGVSFRSFAVCAVREKDQMCKSILPAMCN